jgi:hypothetical protein
MTESQFRNNHLRVVDGKHKKAWDPKLKRLVRYKPRWTERWNTKTQTFDYDMKVWPTLGFMCEECKWSQDDGDLYLVGDKAVCLKCGMKIVNEKEIHEN